MPLYIGLDVGGTTMKAGAVDDTGKIIGSAVRDTEAHRGQQFGLERMCETIRAAAEDAGVSMSEIASVGVATPGTMDIPAGVILDPPNLRPWQNVPVKEHIQNAFGKPTAFQNDANAAAFGEFWAGAGREIDSMVLFTLGTGIGGGIILGDRILQGEHSHGAEVGHTKIEMTQPRTCGCGRLGCVEAYASATAVVKRTREALVNEKSSLSDVEESLTAHKIFDAAKAGDALASRIVEETAYYLGVAAMNLMHIIDPDMVVFGGGMIAAGESFLVRIRHHIKELAFPVPAEKTLVRYATLGADAGLIGAAACGRQVCSLRSGE